MSESTTTPQGGSTTTEPKGEGSTTTATGAEAGSVNPPAGGSRTFTQDEVNSLFAREKRDVRAEFEAKYADYDELKAKAEQFDAIEEARKTELERANDAAAKAEQDAADWKAKFEAAEAERERAEAVRAAAAEFGVSAETLSRMSGDVRANAEFLRAQEDARPKYGDMRDDGEQPQALMTPEEVRGIKDPGERIRARVELNRINGKR